MALEQRLYEESLKVLDEGQVLNGVIVAKYQDELLVDIGGKSEGTLPFRELSRDRTQRTQSRRHSRGHDPPDRRPRRLAIPERTPRPSAQDVVVGAPESPVSLCVSVHSF
jgi:hypothetical protein